MTTRIQYSPPVTPLLGILCLLLLLISGCSDPESHNSGSGSHVRLLPLELRLQENAGERPAPSLYRRLEASPDCGWSVEAPEKHRYRRVPPSYETDQKHLLVLEGLGNSTIEIPGPFDPKSFNRLGLEVDASRQCTFEVRFHNKKNFTRDYAKPRASTSIKLIEYKVPAQVRDWKSITKISILTRNCRSRVTVFGMSLFSSPPSSRLPSPDGKPAHISSGGESRMGVGVLADRAVESSFLAAPKLSLRFSYAIPYPLLEGQEDTSLDLILKGENGAEQKLMFALTQDQHSWSESSPVLWRTQVLPLGAFENSAVTARWEVSGKGNSACALAEVSLLDKQGYPLKILLITSDTHRYDHLGHSKGGVEILTPTLDALAEEGLVFEDCFSSTNTTNPSHVALMTGTSPRDTGINVNNSVLSDEAPTLAEAFHEAGFATYSSVSIKHLSPKTSGLGQGFDRAAAPSKRDSEAEQTIGKLTTWMKQSEELSVFVWLHLFDAHTPYEPEESFITAYYEDPERAFDPRGEFVDEVPEAVIETLYPDPALKDIQFPSTQYKAEISYLDQELSRLLDLSVMRNAIVAFTADHGESLGAHGIYFSHDGLYPDSIHVPMIIRYPGGPKGARSSIPIEQIDLGRTLLDLAGLVGTEFPGENLIALSELTAEETEPRFTIAAHHRSAAITKDGWHLMLSMNTNGGVMTLQDPELHAVELYNLRADPECLSDLLEVDFERASAMRAELVEWLLSARHLNWDKETLTDAETIRELEALGYTAGTQESNTTDAPIISATCKCKWCKRFP